MIRTFASSLLATLVGAELFVISTAVEQVFVNYHKPNQAALDRISLAEAEKYLRAGRVPGREYGTED